MEISNEYSLNTGLGFQQSGAISSQEGKISGFNENISYYVSLNHSYLNICAWLEFSFPE